MASARSNHRMDGGSKQIRSASKAKSHNSLLTNGARNSSAGRPKTKTADDQATTPPPPLQKAASSSRIHTGQSRNTATRQDEINNKTQTTQRNNNNTASSRTRKPVSAGSATRGHSGGHVKDKTANSRSSHLERRNRSAEMAKRNGSGSKRQTSSKGRMDEIDKDVLSSPDLQLESDDDDDNQNTILFTDVPGDTESQGQAKRTTICPQTILEQCQEKQFNKVYEIDLRTSKITKIKNLEKFTCLRVLDLSSNHIKRIENLEDNKELKELKLYDNYIAEITNLDSTRELCTLQLQHNRIKKLGKGLSCLRKLSVLRLDSNRISKIESREMASCSQLTYLDISSNTIDDLKPLNCLSSLEELHATHNQLSTIADLSRCRKLQEVDVSYNRVTDIVGLKGLPHLTVLNVSHNLLNTPCLKAIGRLKSLQTLDISHNNLVDLDSINPQFPSIEVLNVTHNKITKWNTLAKVSDSKKLTTIKHVLRNTTSFAEMDTCCLSKCENLSELYASGNPVCEESGEEKYNYHGDLPTIITSLEILDGINVKKNMTKSVPFMRPMSAATAVSARQVQNQLLTVEREIQDFGANLTARFESTRTTFDSLPAEAPSPRPPSRPFSHLSITSISTVGESRPGSSSTVGEFRPSSRCNSRRRIAEAQAYAAQLHF